MICIINNQDIVLTGIGLCHPQCKLICLAAGIDKIYSVVIVRKSIQQFFCQLQPQFMKVPCIRIKKCHLPLAGVYDAGMLVAAV